MNSIFCFTTSCGHHVTSKPTRGGSEWISRIKGPKATGESGAKTVYSAPNEDAVKERVARFLKVDPSEMRLAIQPGSKNKAAPVATKLGRRAPSNKRTPSYPRPARMAPPTSDKFAGPNIVTIRSSLRDSLRQMRDHHAQARGVPPHFVFDDQVLNSIVAVLPLNETELGSIQGLGEMKVLEYGPRIFQIIRNHRESLYRTGDKGSSKRRRVLVEV
jgi:superfamily II DNA helicase RecQ